MSWYDRGIAFPGSWKLKYTLTYPPHVPGLLCREPSAPLTMAIEHSVSYGVTRMAITVPRAPAPPWGVTPPRGACLHPRSAFPHPHRSAERMRQTSPLSHPTHDGLVHESVQVAAGPCWEAGLPAVVSSLSGEGRGPVPRRASAVRFPVFSRSTAASPSVQEVRRAETPAMIAPSMTNQFRGCSHAVMCRLPHARGPQIAPTGDAQGLRGSRAVYATHSTCGYPTRAVVSLRACIGPLARRDLHPLD